MHLQKAVGPFHLLVVKDERIGLEPPPPRRPRTLVRTPFMEEVGSLEVTSPQTLKS